MVHIKGVVIETETFRQVEDEFVGFIGIDVFWVELVAYAVGFHGFVFV